VSQRLDFVCRFRMSESNAMFLDYSFIKNGKLPLRVDSLEIRQAWATGLPPGWWTVFRKRSISPHKFTKPVLSQHGNSPIFGLGGRFPPRLSTSPSDKERYTTSYNHQVQYPCLRIPKESSQMSVDVLP
jgi:hypothetical protein